MRLDRAARSLLMSDLLSGLWLTPKYMFRLKATIVQAARTRRALPLAPE